MSRLSEMIKELCPDGVEYKKLGEVCEILDSQRKPVTKKDRTAGQYPYYGANGIQDYVDKFIFDGIFLLVGEDGSVVTEHGSPVIHWATGKIWVNNHAHILKEKEELRLRFLFHYLQTVNIRHLVKGVPPKLNQKNLLEILIPVPPLAIQNEIVKLLDNFTELTAELTAELQLRKKQYSFYRDSLLNFSRDDVDVEWRTLGETCDTLSGFPFDSSQFTSSGVRLMRGMNVKRGVLDFREENNRYWKGYDGLEKYLLESDDIIIAMDGSLVGQSYGLVKEEQRPLLLVQRVARVRSRKANPHYIYHYISSGRFTDYVNLKRTAGAVPHISLRDIEHFKIPFPSTEKQNQIAAILDRFDALCHDLTQGLPAEIAARKKQYEYYRDKLLTFPRKGESGGSAR